MKRAGRAVIFELRDMISTNCQTTALMPTGRGSVKEAYVRAVPLPFYDGLLARLRSAWEIVCGRAYPMKWPEAGELEKALNGIE